MKISDQRPPSSVGRTRQAGGARNTGEGGFPQPAAARPATSSGVAPVAPLAALDAVLTVQAVSDRESGRRRAVTRGHRLLDELHELRLALIDGRLPEEALRRLGTLVEERRPEVDDAGLAAALDDIELRAAVELAKIERREPD